MFLFLYGVAIAAPQRSLFAILAFALSYLVHLHISLPLPLTVTNHLGRFLLTQVLRVSCVGWPDMLLSALFTFPNSFA